MDFVRSVLCRGLAAMDSRMFVRSNFFYCFSEVSLERGVQELYCGCLAARGRPATGQRR